MNCQIKRLNEAALKLKEYIKANSSEEKLNELRSLVYQAADVDVLEKLERKTSKGPQNEMKNNAVEERKVLKICFEKCGSMERAPTTDKDSLVRVLERGGIYLRGMCGPATTNRKGMIPPLSASGFGQTPMKRKTTAQLDKNPIPVKMKEKSEKLLKEVKKLLIEERKLEDQIWCLDASKMEIARCSEAVDLPERKLKRHASDRYTSGRYAEETACLSDLETYKKETGRTLDKLREYKHRLEECEFLKDLAQSSLRCLDL